METQNGKNTAENASGGRLLRMTLMGGQARAFLCDTTMLAQRAREIHHASDTCSAALGRMISAAAILGANLKSEGDRVTATISGGGPAGALCAVAGPDGAIKVTLANPEVELPLKNGRLDVGGALGRDGQLTVIRSFGFGEPYVGRVALVSGEVAEDFAMYYLESEQTPSLCALGALVGGGELAASGGLLVQAMPGCSEELLSQLEVRAELFGAISQLLADMTLEEIVSGCFAGLEPEILEELPLTLRCDCSREGIERVLLSMGEKELRDVIDTQGGCEVVCHFCRRRYAFTRGELEALLASALDVSPGEGPEDG